MQNGQRRTLDMRRERHRRDLASCDRVLSCCRRWCEQGVDLLKACAYDPLKTTQEQLMHRPNEWPCDAPD